MSFPYAIARLLDWRGRTFDRADGFDWLDVLDDFGPALIRFLIDERWVTSIPETDGSLRSLRESLQKNPLSSLASARGAVWILFAFKDDLRGLPPPFRQDGVMLPFSWTRDGDGAAVPKALAELAEWVKAQLGVANSAWRLSAPSYFNGQVDLDMPGATFASAWGALATGLFLALHPEVPLAAWPFSTVAFDFAANEPLAVGGLEAKFALAASLGASEIAVAPVQFADARRTLSELKCRNPGDARLSALRIYPWKWTDDVQRSLRALTRCNQMTPRRRLIRTLVLNLALACAVVFAGGTYLWDCRREKVAYYADYVDRRGVAEGLYPLPDTSDLSGRYRFTFRGYDSLWPFGRRPVVRTVWCVDGDGKPMRDRTDRPEHRRVAGRSFSYGDDGRLKDVSHFDVDRRVFDVFRYSGKNLEVADVCTVDSNEVVRLGVVEFTARAARKGDAVRRIVYERDATGLVLSTAYQTGMSGDAAKSGSGIARVVFEHDALGRIVEARYRSADGKSAVDGRGIHCKKYRYDGWCLAEENRFAADGALAERATYRKDVRNRLTVFLANGKRDEHFYDELGRISRVEYLSAEGRLESDADGVAMVRYAYDAKGRRQETLCGADGKSLKQGGIK